MKKIFFLTVLFGWSLVWGSSTIGSFLAIKGEVSVERGDAIYLATVGFALEEKDRITTKSYAKAQIMFRDDTVITLGKNSVISVSEYLFEIQNKQTYAAFDVEKGAFRVITGKIGKMAPTKFKIKTKNSSIGFRGTQVIAEIEAIEKIACTFGEIIVSNAFGQVIVKTGELTEVAQGKKPSVPRVYKHNEIQILADIAGGGEEKMEPNEVLEVYPEGALNTATQSTLSQDTMGVNIDNVVNDTIDLNTLNTVNQTNFLNTYRADTFPEPLTDYAYVEWGLWVLNTEPVSTLPIDVDPTAISGGWTSGEVTPSSVIDSLKAASTIYYYGGEAMGVINTASGSEHATGSFFLDVDFGASSNPASGSISLSTPTSTFVNLSVSTSSFEGSGLSMDVIDSGGTIDVGTGSGAAIFYGPDAFSIGGTFSAEGPGGSVSGVLVGAGSGG